MSLNKFGVNQSYFLIAGSSAKEHRQDDIVSPSSDGHEPFRRLERNRGVDYKPFKFPDREFSGRVRWPAVSEVERLWENAFNTEAKAVNTGATVIFPRGETHSEHDSTNTKIPSPIVPIRPIDRPLKETNEQNIDALLQNAINISTFVVNKTAIESGLEPLIYIDDDGIFQVKYAPKGENISMPNDDIQQPNSNEPNLASIYNTKETAIISNDNQQIPQDHQTSIEANTQSLATTTTTMKATTTTAPATPTIDLFHDADASVDVDVGADADVTNNTEMIFQWNGPNTKAPSSKPTPQPQIQQPMADNRPPRLFNGRPIFA